MVEQLIGQRCGIVFVDIAGAVDGVLDAACEMVELADGVGVGTESEGEEEAEVNVLWHSRHLQLIRVMRLRRRPIAGQA